MIRLTKDSIKTVKEGKLSFFTLYTCFTYPNVLLIFLLLLHNFINFSPHFFYSLLHNFILFPAPPLHFYCFPSKKPKRPNSGLKGQTQIVNEEGKQ